MSKAKIEVIGNNTLVEIGGHKHVPAKIDTGADSSSVWASQIEVNKKGILHFALFDKKSPFYDGKLLERKKFNVVKVRSSNGHEQERYQVIIPVTINSRKINATFTLADRSKNTFPILIGRRTLKNKFLVDVSRNVIPQKDKSTKTLRNNNTKDNNTKKTATKKKLATTHTAERAAQVAAQKKTAQAKTKAKTQAKATSRAKITTQVKATPNTKQARNAQLLIQKSLDRNDYASVISDKTRRLYFGKYDHSFALANTLWNIYRIKTVRGIDLSADFAKIYPLLKLRRLVNRLLTDPKALINLSNYAVNIICLSEILYPHKGDKIHKLARLALNSKPDHNPVDYIALCLQIIVADSHYFGRPVSDRHKLVLRQLLRRVSTYIESFYNNIPKPLLLKFIACARLVGQEKEYTALIKRIMLDVTEQAKSAKTSTSTPQDNQKSTSQSDQDADKKDSQQSSPQNNLAKGIYTNTKISAKETKNENSDSK